MRDNADSDKRSLSLCLDKSYLLGSRSKNRFTEGQLAVFTELFGEHNEDYDDISRETVKNIRRLSSRNFIFNFLREYEVLEHITQDQVLITPLEFMVTMDNDCATPTSFKTFYIIQAVDYRLPKYFTREGDYNLFVCTRRMGK